MPLFTQNFLKHSSHATKNNFLMCEVDEHPVNSLSIAFDYYIKKIKVYTGCPQNSVYMYCWLKYNKKKNLWIFMEVNGNKLSPKNTRSHLEGQRSAFYTLMLRNFHSPYKLFKYGCLQLIEPFQNGLKFRRYCEDEGHSNGKMVPQNTRGTLSTPNGRNWVLNCFIKKNTQSEDDSWMTAMLHIWRWIP